MIIGHEREFALVVRALSKGIPVILEGEAGTGKTEMAKEAARLLKRHLYRVDGDQELSSLKIQGWFDPPMVLSKGYSWESFLPGPLSQAMTQGGIFFFNEVNRAPSETINAVLTALDERMITIPRLGTITAEPAFGCVFTCNPLDRVGTNPLPQAFFDRCVWLQLDHLPLEQAMAVVQLRTDEDDPELVRLMCRITEGTRKHQDVVKGGSIRAAIFMVKLASSIRSQGEDPCGEMLLKEIAKSALTKKIRLRYNSELTEEQVVEDIVNRVLGISTEKKKTA
ncbi:MAG: MoxR family ATPase [Nitrospirales bacterium]|nr:MoxR family ATPase [Nitrospirales bacterium]